MTHSITTQMNERYSSALMNTFGIPQLTLSDGHGCILRDADGNEYLDLLAGIAVNVLGQCHPKVTAAIANQLNQLGHVSNFFATEPQIRLAEEILAIVEPGGVSPGSRAFLTNSGTEANECALKMVKSYGNTTHKHRILALTHSFHGRSTGALSLTWKEQYRTPFAPLIPGVEFIPANDPQALARAMTADTAGIFVEPIQGEAGVYPLEDEYLRLVRRLSAEVGALLVVDEVQTGMGRTGEWMGHHSSGIIPDIVTLAKGLAGGMPIGACIGIGTAGSILGPGAHGSTFGGNPICAAAALAVIETIRTDGLLEHTQNLGAQWIRELRECGIPTVKEIRGRGLLIGIEFTEEIAPFLVDEARARGFIMNATSSTVVRLAPPLILSAEEAASFTSVLPEIVDTAMTKLSQRYETEEGATA